MNKFNHNFDENDIPYGVGDRYYAQDMVRDNRYLQDLIVKTATTIYQRETGIINGLILTKSSPNVLSLTGGAGYCHFSVSVPDDEIDWTVPAPIKSEDISVLVEAESQTISITNEMLDGDTHYVKLRYKESIINERVRQNLGGLYPYVIADSYRLVIDKIPNTKYDILLGTFSGNGSIENFTRERNEKELETIRNFNIAHPIGVKYEQYPNCASPNEMWGDFSVWEEIKFGGVFFRSEGGDALPYTGEFKCVVAGNSISLDSSDAQTMQYETLLANYTVNKLIVVAGGEHRSITAWNRTTHTITLASAFTDASSITSILIGQSAGLPNIKGQVYGNGASSVANGTGAFINSILSDPISVWRGSALGGTTNIIDFKASNSNKTYRDDCDTVIPVNLAIKIWKRVS